MNAPLNQRQLAILNLVRQDGRVFVENLVDAFGTTPQTIRRDLQILADTGEVMRFHGGASLPAGIEYLAFEVREGIAAAAKEEIGKAVASRVPNNALVMINAGTTTAAVARSLQYHAGVKVITDNVGVANDLRKFPGLEVIIPGGTLRRSDGAVLGEAATDFIRQFRADVAVIGAAAVDSNGDLLDFDMGEVHVARAIIENSRHVILAVDSSKFGRTAPVCIAPLSCVHTIVTERCPDEAFLKLCRSHRVDVVEASRNE